MPYKKYNAPPSILFITTITQMSVFLIKRRRDYSYAV